MLKGLQLWIDAEGWFHTGDVGELNAAGCLKVVDRIKNNVQACTRRNMLPLNNWRMFSGTQLSAWTDTLM